MSRDCDIAIIGAGLAGLHAANLLEAQGLRIAVVEAKDRVGGRIYSMRQLGRNAEAGGTYIGAGYERVLAAAERFGIRLIDVTPILKFFREQALVVGDEIIRQSDWPAHRLNPFPEPDRELLPWNYHRVLTMRSNPLERPEDWLDPRYAHLDVSMRDWMQSLGLGDDVVRFGYGINTTFGASAADVSALLMLFRGAFSKAQRQLAPADTLGYTVENGVDRLPHAMAGQLRGELLLEAPVESITQTSSAVQLGLGDGRRLTANRVLCTVPLPALGAIRIEPGLPARQAEAISALGNQPLTQCYLGVRAPFWQDDGYPPSMFTDSLPGMVAAVRSGEDPEQVTHLTAWVLGEDAEALDRVDDTEALRSVVAAIERIRPAARGCLEPIGLKSWGGDPFAGGAWAYYRPGQVSRFAAQLGAAQGRIHFGGEHLARATRGMEAAFETAETAVEELLRAAA